MNKNHPAAPILFPKRARVSGDKSNPAATARAYQLNERKMLKVLPPHKLISKHLLFSKKSLLHSDPNYEFSVCQCLNKKVIQMPEALNVEKGTGLIDCFSIIIPNF